MLILKIKLSRFNGLRFYDTLPYCGWLEKLSNRNILIEI